MTNPPIRAGKEVVHGILLSGIDHLKEGGMILAVLQKKQGAPSAMKKWRKLTEIVKRSQKKRAITS